jgi:signal transduction histidine kinase
MPCRAHTRVELRAFADDLLPIGARAKIGEQDLHTMIFQAHRPARIDDTADIEAAESGGALCVRVRDNGRGGADCIHGSGLLGLKDRAEALGGHLQVDSPPRAGTTLEMTLPLSETGGPAR